MRRFAYLLVLYWVSSAGAAIVWDYDSPLTVIENITDTGTGAYPYEYSYSFVNEDSWPITIFGVYTTFQARGESTFTGLHPTWVSPYFGPMTDVAPYLDGRNLDPTIVHLIVTTNCVPLVVLTVCSAETAIQPGQSVSGFSFTSSVLDTSPKYYFYSTTDSGYVAYTECVAAVGTTVPEPASLILLGFGALALLKPPRAK